MSEFDVNGYNSHECYIHNHGYYLGAQSQQAKINELQKKINNVNEVLSKANIKDDRFSLEFALNEIEELLK